MVWSEAEDTVRFTCLVLIEGARLMAVMLMSNRLCSPMHDTRWLPDDAIGPCTLPHGGTHLPEGVDPNHTK